MSKNVRPMTRMLKTCISYANSIHINKTPPNVLLTYITNLIERIRNIDGDSYPDGYKEETLAKCWDCYSVVLKRIKVNDDESWNQAASDGSGHWRPKVNIKFYGDTLNSKIDKKYKQEVVLEHLKDTENQ